MDLHIAKVESTQLMKQVHYLVEGGEDICCAMIQWVKKWSGFNEFSTPPNQETGDFRLFAIEFAEEFE